MSQNKKYDIGVYICRAQPPHAGHLETFRRLTQEAKRVIVLIGSANVAPSIKNPFSSIERGAMFNTAAMEMGIDPTCWITVPLNDFPYQDNLWYAEVQSIVETFSLSESDDLKVCIIGFERDASSYYLEGFPQWHHIYNSEIKDEDGYAISATDIREELFSLTDPYEISGLPKSVAGWLKNWISTRPDQFSTLREEFLHIAKYKQSWASAPFPPMFVTVDAVVVQSGHVLLVQRDALPGKGQWALPGGFLNQGERIEDGILRELREETKLKVPLPVLRGSIKASRVFDDPSRSLRGRTITHAALIDLGTGPLPPVKGSDDARKAKWVPISLVKKNMVLFEDHKAIIDIMV